MSDNQQCGVIIVKVSILKYLCVILYTVDLILGIFFFPQKNTEDEIRDHIFKCLIHLQNQVNIFTASSLVCH